MQGRVHAARAHYDDLPNVEQLFHEQEYDVYLPSILPVGKVAAALQPC